MGKKRKGIKKASVKVLEGQGKKNGKEEKEKEAGMHLEDEERKEGKEKERREAVDDKLRKRRR
ncbi:hypothetical protein E2C01_084635 [Portunus trituberculatus]|uniref:Uncharacterized protein n=1 Tax=Portunus trituberculatus TaxID=210409 RepID=A0A5B7IVW0_PORTR|nr:hypothetical protein [Portunus trituberculatus]